MNPFTNYYGMQFNPFDKTLPSRDAFETLDMEQVRGRLEHLKAHPGIGLFTAAPGQGKTFSLRCFADSLNPNLVKFYYICLSTVSTTEFYRQLCVTLGLEVSYKKTVMFQRIQDYLYSMSMNKNVHCMICLDEAQYLNADIFKDLKMLCNFCYQKSFAILNLNRFIYFWKFSCKLNIQYRTDNLSDFSDIVCSQFRSLLFVNIMQY